MKNSNKGAKPTLSIIGPGRLGSALALGLTSCGYRVLALVSRHRAKNTPLLKKLGPPTVALSTKQFGRIPPSDIILVATPDDALQSTALELAQQLSTAPGVTVLHTSGALSSVLLAPLSKVGLHTGSIHPLVSVSDPVVGAERFRGAYFCVEGDKVALRVGQKLVRDLGGHSFSVPRDKKALYHAAAVMTSGHLTALFDIAIEMMAACGLTVTESHQILWPLLNSAVANLHDSSTAQALTGTYARGDIRTAAEHLIALNKAQLPDASKAYQLLAQRSLELAAKRRMPAATLKKLKSALEQFEE